jgi:hypothetical protein
MAINKLARELGDEYSGFKMKLEGSRIPLTSCMCFNCLHTVHVSQNHDSDWLTFALSVFFYTTGPCSLYRTRMYSCHCFETHLNARLHLQCVQRFEVRFSSSDECERVDELCMF